MFRYHKIKIKLSLPSQMWKNKGKNPFLSVRGCSSRLNGHNWMEKEEKNVEMNTTADNVTLKTIRTHTHAILFNLNLKYSFVKTRILSYNKHLLEANGSATAWCAWAPNRNAHRWFQSFKSSELNQPILWNIKKKLQKFKGY